ncbi:unnamed protein product [Cylindrotheca closterium]|uniref:Leucine-rich repeat-containing N-terminal plant-type domain-containing protein n=1 Tax=Cylindrotheca closterium TaxID=2856 RepID=A0AAD2FPM9_9STRA|nr:unnamed protein product [Cylindrotheca closterium]
MPEKSEEQQQVPEKSPPWKFILIGVGVVVFALAIGLPIGLLAGGSGSDDSSSALSATNGSPNASPTSSGGSGGGSPSGGGGSFPNQPPVSSPTFQNPPANRVPIKCLPDDYRIDALTSGVCSGGLRREELYLRTLRQITAQSVLTNPSRPQGKAFAFLLNYDPYFQGSCSTTGLKERYILMTLFFSTKGEYWSRQVGWCGGTQHCTWSGVSCSSSGTITGIELATNNLSGTIPEEFYALQHLQRINLFANSILGTIPNFSTLYNLKEIDLQNNLLTGNAFPTSLPNGVTHYKVSGNNLSGTIPTSILDKWTQLQTLWAGNNQISGTIPTQFGRLNRLTSLYLYENRLQGSLPAQLGNILLQEIWLSNNFFEQQIPESLLFLGSLKLFRLENNVFSGSLATWIGLLTNLQDLRVNNNNIAGTVPVQLDQLTDLKELQIGTNFWSGNLPNIFRNLQQLETFDASNTDLGGTIPTALFNIPTLETVNLSNSRLSGSIPNTLSNAGNLQKLYLNDMPNLRGNLPSPGQGRLGSLTELLVHRTGLTGSMPTSICALRSDSFLDTLEADCLGGSPKLQCDFPDCCTRCY